MPHSTACRLRYSVESNVGGRPPAEPFFRCTLWGEDGAAEFAKLGLQRGARLRVSGRWAKKPWRAKDGTERIGDNLTVTAVSVHTDTETEISPKESVADQAKPATKRRRKAA